ncbi:hypothetical protein ACLOJK_027378 [Asimina triloba]
MRFISEPPPEPPSTPMNAISSPANDVHEEGEPVGRQTHHARAVVALIRAIHHDGDDEHIPDPSRPQADVDHSGHTRQVFLARHRPPAACHEPHPARTRCPDPNAAKERRHRLCTTSQPPSPAHHRLHTLRCQHDATASLARCQPPAIPHVGEVGVGVSRPQRTTAMPTSSAIQDAAAAIMPAPIRIAYK